MTRQRSMFEALRDSRASGTAEFALVLPILIIFLLGIIDIGRVMWVTNMAEKATQMGARYAIVTDILPPKVIAEDYVGKSFCGSSGTSVCTAGDLITGTGALGPMTCTSSGCSCPPGATCPASPAMAAGSFAKLGLWMRNSYPDASDDKIQVIFQGSGLGFAGDPNPNGPDVIPLVTVKLSPIPFAPVSLFKFVSFNLPSFATTLTDESAVGNQSN